MYGHSTYLVTSLVNSSCPVSAMICVKREEEDRVISSSLLWEGDMWDRGLVNTVLKAARLYRYRIQEVASNPPSKFS